MSKRGVFRPLSTAKHSDALEKTKAAVVTNLLQDVKAGVHQIPKAKVIDDMCDLIRRLSLTEEQVGKFFDAIMSRMVSKQCVRCGKLKADRVEGSVRKWMGGEQFLCSACQEILGEKGQLED